MINDLMAVRLRSTFLSYFSVQFDFRIYFFTYFSSEKKTVRTQNIGKSNSIENVNYEMISSIVFAHAHADTLLSS